jgi:sigma-B regulation protein RsbU (phosphoserine phosphatase)
MKRGAKDSARGSSLGSRFALAMGLALALVGLAGGLLLHKASERLLQNQTAQLLKRTAELTAQAETQPFEPSNTPVIREGPLEIQTGHIAGQPAKRYTERLDRSGSEFVTTVYMPDVSTQGEGLLGLIASILGLMVVVGAGVALAVASQVTSPLNDMVAAVQRLSHGDLRLRLKSPGTRELGLLSRALERMTGDLEEGRAAELELSVRERELELAASAREALLPDALPLIPGVDIGTVYLTGAELSGSFHDYFEFPDGKVGLLVCDVTGQGVPAAIVGAMARGLLRSELSREGDLAAALARVNRELHGRLRRGSCVTALFALVDAKNGRATVACAGHRLPLLRKSASDGKLRRLQPEGIALGLDRGPVFERALTLQDLAFEPGDGLLLCTAGAARVSDPSGQEFGETRLYNAVAHMPFRDAQEAVRSLRGALQHFAAGQPLPDDVSLLCILRLPLEE